MPRTLPDGGVEFVQSTQYLDISEEVNEVKDGLCAVILVKIFADKRVIKKNWNALEQILRMLKFVKPLCEHLDEVRCHLH